MYVKYVPVLSMLSMLLGSGSCNEKSTGHWSEWEPWSECSRSCGGGVQSRTSTWIEGKGEKKFDPPYTLTQNENCGIGNCPVDGRWSAWSRWNRCTEPCGTGLRRRHRTCSRPSYGGDACEGENFEEEECNPVPCPPRPRNVNISACTKEHFICTSKQMCIPIIELCDDTVQCHDGSDEKRCYDVHDGTDNSRYSPVKNSGTVHIGSLSVLGSLGLTIIYTFIVG